MNRALGLIEVVGLTNAIIVADTMLKASNIRMEDVEITKGMGFVTVKVSGDVGAVKAAIDSGKSLALSFNKFVSSKVIPRPANSLDGFFHLDENNEIEVKTKDEKKSKVNENNLSEKKIKEAEVKTKLENEEEEKKVENRSEIKNNLSEKEVKKTETEKVVSKENKKTQSKKVQLESKNLKTSE